MQYYALLALAPAVVLGCLNPNSNKCASYIKNNPAVASPFCASFTQGVKTATTGLPAWATNCSNKPKLLTSECACYYSGGVPPPTTTPQATTTRTTSPGVPPTTTPGQPPVTTTTTGNTTPTGNPGSCNAPVDSLVGYGAGTTGGGSGSGTTVSSCSALQAAVGAGGVVRVSGQLSCSGVYDVASGTSVIGVGSNSGITGGLRIKGKTNVIIRNLKLAPCKGCDALGIDSSTKVWVDHNDFQSVGIVGGKDDYDGLLDITHGADGITVSWNKFSNHWKGSLVGHSDSNSGEDTGKLKVTYHHNYWNNVNSRLPSLRFGTGHVYSSCFENIPTSGINSRMGAVVRAENNYFNNVVLALVTDLDSDTEGSIQSIGNIFAGSTTTRITKVGSLNPPYAFVADPASCICARVKASAGLGVVS